jgi:transcription elongation factor Elf1
MSQLISDSDYVVCAICGLRAEMLTTSHFKYKHGISFKEYQEKYPDSPTMTLSKQKQRAQQISNKAKGRTAYNKGLKASDESKRKQSDTMKQKYANGEIVHWNLGGSVSDSTKQKISESMQKFVYTAEEMNYINEKRNATKKEKILNGWINPLKGTHFDGERLEKSRIAISKASKIKQENDWMNIKNKIDNSNLILNSIDVNDGNRLFLTCKICKSEFNFQSQIFRNSKNKGIEICPTCFPRSHGRSIGEEELYNFIHDIIPSAIANDKSTLGHFGKELDVYIPELKLAFEYDGLYYHSDKVHSYA